MDLLRRLMYRRGGNCYFSDPEVLLHRLPSAEDRLHLLKALTYQTAVLVRMRLRPESDIDKISATGAPPRASDPRTSAPCWSRSRRFPAAERSACSTFCPRSPASVCTPSRCLAARPMPGRTATGAR
ncbi:MAG: hypothetical protein U1F77_00990 [Kiritimatiellia bacterium]